MSVPPDGGGCDRIERGDAWCGDDRRDDTIRHFVATTAADGALRRSIDADARQVRNKNVTFIDGLESWGFTHEMLGALARDFRKRFSAASGVSERKGSEGRDAARGALWSLSVQVGLRAAPPPPSSRLSSSLLPPRRRP